jgi:hypothetical protein
LSGADNALELTHERHQRAFLLWGELQVQNKAEKLHGIFER